MAKQRSKPLPIGRQTRPSVFDGYAVGGSLVNGGLGVVARRSWDPGTAMVLEQLAKGGAKALQTFSQTMPLRMLRVLVQQHETAGMALSNDLSFTFAPSAARLVAVKDYKNGKGTVDESETAYLNRLWSRTSGLTQHTGTGAAITEGGYAGGMAGFQKTLARQHTTDGMSAVECVIGDDGVADIIDVDGLTFRWIDTNDGRLLQQSQSGVPTGWRTIDTSTVRVGAWNGSRQNPYGEPRFGRFLGVGLGDIAEQRSVRDWLYSQAWPRIAFEFPIEQWVQYATLNPNVCKGLGPNEGDLTATEWAEREVDMMQSVCEGLVSSDFIFMASGGKASALNVSASGQAELLDRRSLRLAQSLDHPPALLGFVYGGTQAYSSVQLRQYGAKLSGVAEDPDQAVVWVANTDLRARGVDMIAQVVREPIILTDALLDAQAREINTRVGFAWVDRGVITPNDNAIALSGSGIADATRAFAAAPTLGAALAPSTAGKDGAKA